MDKRNPGRLRRAPPSTVAISCEWPVTPVWNNRPSMREDKALQLARRGSGFAAEQFADGVGAATQPLRMPPANGFALPRGGIDAHRACQREDKLTLGWPPAVRRLDKLHLAHRARIASAI